MSTKHADAQPGHESKTNAEQQIQGETQEQSPNLFALSDFSQRSPAQILHLQRTIGNARTQQLLNDPPRSNRRIQREIGGGTVGGGISSTSAKLNWQRTHKFPPRVMGLGSISIEAGVAAEVDLSWSKAPASIGAETKGTGDVSIKAKAELWKAQVDKAAQEREDVWQSIISDHLDIAKTELEFEAPKHAVNAKKQEEKTTMGATLVITMKGGDKHKIFINAFEAITKGNTTDVNFLQAGASVEFQLIPTRFREAALMEGLNLKGGLMVNAKATIQPHWPAVIFQLAQKFGPGMLGQAFRGAAMSGGWVTSGLIGGALATIVGYASFIKEMGELHDLRNSANAAVPGYATGFMKGIGVTSYNGGDADWALYGQGRGQVAFGTALQEMKKRLAAMAPVYNADPSAITDEELSEMLKTVIQEKSEDIYGSIYGAVNMPIRVLHYNKYREDHDLDTRGQEMNARAYAGLPPTGSLPDPFQKTDVPMESPADGGAAGGTPPAGGAPSNNAGGSPASDPDVGMFEPMPGEAGPQTNPYGGTSEMPMPGNASGRTDQQQAEAEDDDKKNEYEHNQKSPKAPAAKPKPAPARNNSGRTAVEQAEAEAKELKLREEQKKKDQPDAPIERNASGRTEAEQAEAEAEELKQREAAGLD
jgi:hypothetical protein